jgi:glycosyltransferase 2 family protein
MNGFLSSTRSEERTWVLAKRAARVTAAVLLITVVLSFVDAREVWLHLQTFDARAGVAMFAVNVLLLVLFAARWRSLATALGIEAPYMRFLRGTWLGALLSQLGPSIVLNEITRFRMLTPYAGKWQLAASQVFDRISGNVVLAGVILLLVPYYLGVFGTHAAYRILFAIAGLALAAGVVLVLAHRWQTARAKLGSVRGVWNPFACPRHYLYSLAIQLLLMTNLWLAAYGLGIAGSGLDVYLVAPLVLGTLTLLPISIADWGSREAAALLFFSATALNGEQIVAMSVLYGGANLASALPAALLLLGRPKS